MLNRKWVFLLVVVSLAVCQEVVEDDDESPPKKEPFIPIEFVAPQFNKESPKPYFFDYFPKGAKIGNKWVKSIAKKDGADAEIAKYNGEWDIGAPTKVVIEGDHGLIVKTKARHHAITAKLNRPFKFGNENLIVQYDVKFEEGQECGGGYLKLLSEGAEKNLATVQDKTPYTIMFGPDKCGSTGKVHLIFRYNNPKNGSIDEYHAKQPSNVGTTYWDDHNTHLYTLVLKPSGDFAVSVDGKSLFYGNMLYDLAPPLTPPLQIADPNDKKPEDWDDRAEIEDENATKPDDWDETQPKEIVDESATMPSDWNEDENELIPDPEATKPADWDDDMDGDWEPPMIDNPACKGISGCGKWKPPTIKNPKYKGKWVRPKIANPAYKGVWKPRLIDNPHYFEPTPFAGLAPITAVGIELWTMSENIVFDNILITSSEEDASDIARQTFKVKQNEEYRFATVTGDSVGFVKSIVDAANERPWLWAVYVLCVLIPVIFLAVFFFGRSSKFPKIDNKKKNDDSTSDDDVPNLEEEEGNDEKVARAPKITPEERARLLEGINEKLNSMPEVVDDEEENEEDEEKEEEEEEEDEEKKEGVVHENEPVMPTEELAKTSPKPSAAKRRTARRGD
ncbi:unnamed protein product [Caenorhabditis bovis]|uniref:Calnexin n=1 Tax=Caenorhabditis bovis TaxID=2654633 RepID=A0A8S1EL25_9PELO|nr:unnamed protein product [Caenorhabditis bovis]